MKKEPWNLPTNENFGKHFKINNEKESVPKITIKQEPESKPSFKQKTIFSKNPKDSFFTLVVKSIILSLLYTSASSYLLYMIPKLLLQEIDISLDAFFTANIILLCKVIFCIFWCRLFFIFFNKLKESKRIIK